MTGILCTCGHPEEEHDVKDGICVDCLIVEDLDFEGIGKAYDHRSVPDNLSTIEKLAKERKYHTFKLDNLSYIEQLAKEKGIL